MTARAGRSKQALGTDPNGASPSHRVELVPLSKAIGMFDPANVKTHDLPGIKSSLRQHGWVEIPVVDERTGYLGAGHGRVEAVLEMFQARETPPKRVQTSADGDWLLPIMFGAHDSADDLDARHYIVASNGLGPAGGYDAPRLAEVLSSLSAANRLDGTGFAKPDLDSLLASLAPTEPTPAPDQSAKIVTRRSVLVDVADDASQRALLEELSGRGFKCRSLNS